jgi:hypothetical protein
MKSSVLNLLSMKLALAGFVFAGLFLLAPTQTKAQSTKDFYIVPDIPYVTPAIAITRVETKCKSIKSQYEVLDHNSQAYTDNDIKYSFYSAVLKKLYDGKGVKESLEAGLPVFGIDASAALTKGKSEEYKNEAVNLLKL